jgi:NAD(P)-dependent dehydrogenase (short-subunit alcohol dehydrogenase family)
MTRPSVLVTGGATRIGGAITRAFAAAGWHVVIHYKSSAAQADELAGTAREVEYATLKAEVFADVLSALGALPAEGQSIVNSAVDQAFLKIKDVVRLGGLVGQALQRSVDGLTTRDPVLSQQIVEGDERINQLRFDIEEKCVQLIATQQPRPDVDRVAALRKFNCQRIHG